LELIAAQAQMTGSLPNFDGSVAGLAAGVLYIPARDLLLRQAAEASAAVHKTIGSHGLGLQAVTARGP
jgi:hypothetical protein